MSFAVRHETQVGRVLAVVAPSGSLGAGSLDGPASAAAVTATPFFFR